MRDGTESWPVSATQWIFGNESLETTCDRLARLGYQGVELAGEPEQYPAASVQPVVTSHGLLVTSICGIYTPQRDLSHPSTEIRQSGVRYVEACAALAEAVGARVVIVVPTAVGRVQAESNEGDEWRWAVQSFREAADRAAVHGVRLVIEALNRYETYLVNTLDRAAELATEVDRPNVGIMADVFHMNIEEESVAGSIVSHSDLIHHVHLADSNRRAPGRGHTDFAAVIDAVRHIGYEGALTLEFLPSTANPYLAASLDVPEDDKTGNSLQAITYLRNLLGASTMST